MTEIARYKLWLHVERVDEKTDTYEDVCEPIPLYETNNEDTAHAAANIVETLASTQLLDELTKEHKEGEANVKQNIPPV